MRLFTFFSMQFCTRICRRSHRRGHAVVGIAEDGPTKRNPNEVHARQPTPFIVGRELMSPVSEVLPTLSRRGKEVGYISHRTVHSCRLHHEHGESVSSIDSGGLYAHLLILFWPLRPFFKTTNPVSLFCFVRLLLLVRSSLVIYSVLRYLLDVLNGIVPHAS